MNPLLAQSGHPTVASECLFSGVKRTSPEAPADGLGSTISDDPLRNSCERPRLSLRFDVGHTNYSSPLLGVFSNEFTEVGRRH
jgi:hypothetical protein